MASEKTLALRELEQSLRPKLEIKQAGPVVAESIKTGKVLTANRKARLRVERTQLTRAQRMELREKRRARKWLGMEPEQPRWSQEPPKTVDIATLAEQVGSAVEQESEHGG